MLVLTTVNQFHFKFIRFFVGTKNFNVMPRIAKNLRYSFLDPRKLFKHCSDLNPAASPDLSLGVRQLSPDLTPVA